QAMPIFRAEQDKTSTPENRTPYQKDLVHLYNSLFLYSRLRNTIQPENSETFVREQLGSQAQPTAFYGFAQELELYKAAMQKGLPAVQKTDKGEDHNQEEVQALVQFFRRYQDLDGMTHALVVPPLHPEVSRDDWRGIGRSLLESMKSGEIHPALGYYARLAAA